MFEEVVKIRTGMCEIAQCYKSKFKIIGSNHLLEAFVSQILDLFRGLGVTYTYTADIRVP
jgi:hypothetical protein